MPDNVFRLGDLGPDRPLESLPDDAIIVLDDSELWELVPGLNLEDWPEE